MDQQSSRQAALSDAELVRRTRAGQRPAFDELIERYQRQATGIAYRLLGDLHDALEVCQEAFIRAYRNLETLEKPERFKPWLLRIVTNLSLNYRRSRAVFPRLSFEDCLTDDEPPREQQIAAPAFSDEQPQARTHAEELAKLVQDVLARLPEQQRAAFVLFSLEQLPQQEVASILGCSVEAVKWHVFQARRKLRLELAAYL